MSSRSRSITIRIPSHDREAVLGVADREGEHVLESPGSELPQQEEPAAERAGDAGGEQAGARDQLVAGFVEALDRGRRRARRPGRTRRAAPPRSVDQSTAGTSPPGPFRCGSTTCSVNPVATAASNALPPRSSTAMPAADASQCVDATMPNVPRSSGRVVNVTTSAASAAGGSTSRGAVGPAADEMAGDEVAVPGDVDERRLLLGRPRRRLGLERAARSEPAARRRRERARDVALEHDPRP